MATGGTDSGVETGNESNDLDDISINVNIINEMGDAIAVDEDANFGGGGGPSSSSGGGGHFQPCFNQSPSSGDESAPPPPPPTSPNICGSGAGSEDIFPDCEEGSLDGMQGDPGEDCEFLEEEDDDGGGGEEDEDGMPMDRDEDGGGGDKGQEDGRQDESGRGSYTPSPPFLNDFSFSGLDGCMTEAFGGEKHAAQTLLSPGSGSGPPFSTFCGPIPSVIHSICSPPPAPPVTPTASNSCRALVKFEFPEVKLICDFVEPPAGLHSFLNVEPSDRFGYSVLNSSPSTNDCRSLIPYNFEQHELHGKVKLQNRIRNRLYDNWSNLRKEYNERRLRTATSGRNQLMVQKLLGTGIDPNSADEMGRTPLHIAASKGFGDIVRLLLQHGANPNQKDSVGNTPLHLSACTNHFDVVTDLLRAGTDVSTLDNHGRNPLQLAQSKLKLIMQCSSKSADNEEALRVKTEIQQIIEMMTEYLQKKGQDIEANLLNEFATRLTLSQTPQEVDDLLANLSSLSITSSSSPAHPFGDGGGGGRSRAMTNPHKQPPRNPYLLHHHLNPNLARPRSASFSATISPSTSTSLPSSSPSSSSSEVRCVIKPGRLSSSVAMRRNSPSTVLEEQQLLMTQCNKE